MIVVICGPSGAGKGTIVEELVARDPRLWLSRSWTTRPRREGEAADAYVFVDPTTFEARRREGGFLESAEVFGGHRYGTPTPDPPADRDIVLEIDVQGAEQVRARHADALVILIEPPSAEEQERRLRARGDDAAAIEERLRKAGSELARGRALADHVVRNDVLSRAVDEVAGILADRRLADSPGEP